ncbi:MAG: TonB-dependent receptor plug domain-containing protein [Gemmatimonadaceae bacterium]
MTISLEPFSELVPISVQAGRYIANAECKTTLTPIEVASIPGSNADISGAIKTLPGVQNVDEGSGLFVRGGDFTETRMFVDGVPLFSAYQFEAPTGSVGGTVNPFLTSSMAFLSGGFGAEWGNVLSGVVDLRTLGRPARSYTSINASILGLTLGGGLALRKGLGFTATLGATALDFMLRVNGNPRGFSPTPHGRVTSGLASWEYRRTGRVKIFGLVQKNAFGVPVVDPAYTSVFSSNRSSDVLVASWSDSIGIWRPLASASTAGFSRDESKGAYGTFPANPYDGARGAPTVSTSLNDARTRSALFVSFDTRSTSRTEFIAGVRSNRSGVSTTRTTDPSVSFAYVPYGAITLTASWGLYHQTADPAFLDRLSVGDKLPELRANMAIAGVQIGEEQKQIRLEGWSKSYEDLVGLTRSYVTVAGLRGRAHGPDLFARTIGPKRVNLRLTYSLSSSRRNDANTGLDAPASFDITNSVTAIAQKQWRSGFSAGVAYKVATGRPFTDIAGATFSDAEHVYVPVYASPNNERLPSFSRTDMSVSKTRPFGADRFLVVFAGQNNIFNQINTFGYTWSTDYATRIPVRSYVNRTISIGANLSLQAKQ